MGWRNFQEQTPMVFMVNMVSMPEQTPLKPLKPLKPHSALPETQATPDQARQLMSEIAGRDPGGDCWQWLKTNRPDLWRSHMKALHCDDVTAARLTFNKMLAAWEHRQQLTREPDQVIPTNNSRTPAISELLISRIFR